MNYKTIKMPRMLLAGIDVFTTNEREFSGEGAIPLLWNRLFSEDILARIPNRTDDTTVIAAYTDIESDENGLYRFVLGAAVTEFAGLPESFFKRVIPAATYTEWTTEKGTFSEVGITCWQKIWADKSLKSRRTYATDLEIYDTKHLNPESVQFKIFVGVK
jgi:predicted transcriptional regulator YdeE